MRSILAKTMRASLAVSSAALLASAASAATIYTADLGTLNSRSQVDAGNGDQPLPDGFVGSTATGNARLEVSDDASTLTIMIQASGLEPGGVHVGHIHGLFSDGNMGMPIDSTVPTLAQDSDGDGFIELAEGQVTYGPIIVEFGNVDPDLDGTVDFMQVFDLNDPTTFGFRDPMNEALGRFTKTDLLGDDLMSLDLREIVVHGLTVPTGLGAGTSGEVNGQNGYLAVLPVGAGAINAIPEPATWAMMIGGFGLVGGAMRTRARKARIVTA